MRIVAGKFRGRVLATPEDMAVRPTSDRVREALFNILTHGIDDFAVEGAAVIDLFAGTGALGLEALSRGARNCIFVDMEAAARALLRTNIERLGVMGVARIYRRDATALGEAGRREQHDLAFLDPPYGKGLGGRALIALTEGGWLNAGAIVVVEERTGTRVEWPSCCHVLEVREWGDTKVEIGRFVGVQPKGGV